MEHIYLEKVLDNALLLEGEWDFVVIHDPQPAAMLELPARAPRRPTPRHEVDLALPHRPHRREPRRCGSSSGRSSSSTTRRCGRCRSSCPTSLDDGPRRARAAVHRPAVGEEPRAAAMPFVPGDHASSTASTCTARSCARSAGSTRGRTRSASSRRSASCASESPTRSSCSRARWRPTTPRASRYWERRPRPRARRPRHPPAVEHPAGRQRADQRVPARRRRRDAEVAARGLRPHRERGALEGPAGRSAGAAGGITLQIRRRLRRLPRRLRRGVRGSAPSICSPTRSAPTRWARGPRARARATSSRPASSRTG